MIKVLIIHNTDLSNKDFKEKFFTRYPNFRKFPDVWNFTVVKYGSKITGRNYDKLYYDETTIKRNDLWDTIKANRRAMDVFEINITGDSKLKTNIISKIVDLKEKNG